MKNFLNLIILFIAYAVHAANPAFSNFNTNDFVISGTDIRVNPRVLTNANTVYLRVDGNDTTAMKGRGDKPFATWTNAVAAISDNSTLVISGGRFESRGGTISSFAQTGRGGANLNGKTNVSIIGFNNPVIWTTNYGTVLQIRACSNVTVSGITFEQTRFTGTNILLGVVYTVAIQASDTLRFLNLDIRNAPNHGISCAYDQNSTNLLVQGCNFYNVGFTNAPAPTYYDGACVQVIPHSRVIGCYFDRFLRGVEAENTDPTQPNIVNVVIEGNTFRRCWQTAFITIPGEANRITDCSFVGNIYSEPEYTATVSGDIQHTAVMLNDGTTRCTVSGNSIANGEFGVQIGGSIYGSRDNNISGNTISSIGQYSIALNSVGAGIVTNNSVVNNFITAGSRAGVYVSGWGNIIRGNSIVGCGVAGDSPGIAMQNAGGGTRYNQILNNYIDAMKGGSRGICCITNYTTTCTNNLIAGNTLVNYSITPFGDVNTSGHNIVGYNTLTNGIFSTIGNVGIGTTSPIQPLSVRRIGDHTFSGNWIDFGGNNLYSANSDHNFGSGTAGTLSSSYMIIKQTTGNVGIGTNNPQAKVHITPSSSGPINGSGGYLRLDDTNGANRGIFGVLSNSTGFGGWWLGGNSPTHLNYSIIADTSDLILNAPVTGGTIAIRQGGSSRWNFLGGGGDLIPGTGNARDIGTILLMPRTNYSANVTASNGLFYTSLDVGNGNMTVNNAGLIFGSVVRAGSFQGTGGGGLDFTIGSAQTNIFVNTTNIFSRANANFQGTIASSNAFLLPKTNSADVTGPSLYTKDNAGVAEVFVRDSGGTATQISPHASDSPGAAVDADNTMLPVVLKHRNEYLGTEEWIHLSALAREVERLSGKQLVFSRPITKRDWQAEQDAEQQKYDAARAAELAAVQAGDTNVVVRPVADVRKPIPTPISERLVKAKKK